MALNEKEFEILKRIGKLASDIKKELPNFIKQEKNYLKIIEYIEGRAYKEGYMPAFPTTICVNEEAAHFAIYDEKRELKEGDVTKIDFGICDRETGIICDNALTIEIESNKHEKQIKANREGLDKLLNFINTDKKLYEIGKFIDDYAKNEGFTTIHNLSGHLIRNYNLHAGINIPNYDNKDSKLFPENETVAIEPFFSSGSNKVIERGNSNILSVVSSRNTRDIYGRMILNYIKKEFKTLPFAKRWLLNKFDKKKVDYAVNLLKREGILFEYKVLVSEDDSIITQFEETIVTKDNKRFIVTK